MYVTRESLTQPNFLKSAKFQNFTKQIDDTGVELNSKGKKIVPAGTVYKEGEKAIGLTFNDADVTYGPQPIAVMVEGYVIEDRLPATVSEADKATMTGIKFM